MNESWHDKYAGMARPYVLSWKINMVINLTLGVFFGVMALLCETPLAAAINGWSSGAQFGLAFMWLLSPRLTERWKREMERESDKLLAETKETIDRMLADAIIKALRPVAFGDLLSMKEDKPERKH